MRLHSVSLLLSKYEMLNSHKEHFFPIHYVMNHMTRAFYASSVSDVFYKVADFSNIGVDFIKAASHQNYHD